MTPKHQQVVDNTLARMDARVSELIRHCRPASRKQPGETPLKELRETLLGQHLAAIAHSPKAMPILMTGMCAPQQALSLAASTANPWQLRVSACSRNGSAVNWAHWCMLPCFTSMRKSDQGNC